MNHVMAFVLRLAYVSARLGYHNRAKAMVTSGEITYDEYCKGFTSSLWTFADLCDAADELEKPKCHACGAILPE